MNAGRPKAAAVVRSSTQVIWQFASPTLADVVATEPVSLSALRDAALEITHSNERLSA